MNLKKFLWSCTGANKRLLEECDTEHSKYAVMGAAVLFTGVFASISAGYAIYFVFSGTGYALLAAIALGILWGLMIFNLDKFLVISIKNDGPSSKRFLSALPRLVLAVAIGIVIARPLELKLFQKEINDELAFYYKEKDKQDIESKRENYKTQYQDFETDLIERKTEAATAFDLWQKNIELRNVESSGGTSQFTTGRVGFGPEAKLKQEEVAKSETLYKMYAADVVRLDSIITQGRIDAGLTRVKELDKAVVDSLISVAGFQDRNAMLARISSWPFGDKSMPTNVQETVSTDSLSIASTTQTIDNIVAKKKANAASDKTVAFITLLFIIVECLPIVVKLMSSKGDYDIRFQDESDKNRFLSKHELQANKFLIEELSNAQRNVHSEALRQWQENEKGNPNIVNDYINRQTDED